MSEELDDQLTTWQVGDYAEIEGDDFKIVAIEGEFLMEDEVTGHKSSACRRMATSECAYCKEQKPNAKQERYSAGCYAGRMCDDCAYRKYRDHCGVDGTPQLTQADVDEPIEPEPMVGGFVNDLR